VASYCPYLWPAQYRSTTRQPKTLKINEWFANGEVLFENDYIELFNPHVFPVDLSSLYLTDNPITQPDKHQLGPLSFIAGGGFAVLDVDDRNQPGHVDFRLSADGEILALLDAELNEIDKVFYGPQATDTSQGRAPDGLESFEFFELPTPGVANPLGGAVIVTNLIAIDDVWAYELTDTELPAIRRWSGLTILIHPGREEKHCCTLRIPIYRRPRTRRLRLAL